MTKPQPSSRSAGSSLISSFFVERVSPAEAAKRAAKHDEIHKEAQLEREEAIRREAEHRTIIASERKTNLARERQRRKRAKDKEARDAAAAITGAVSGTPLFIFGHVLIYLCYYYSL
jgi:sugar-specific transcriptional regulator TrmB